MYPYYVLAVFSVLLFLHGFFPITKSVKNNDYGPPTRINNISLHSHVYSSDIKKTVIVIIDALRLDFVNTRYMPLTSRITKENGCYNTLIVETPTVTLPRIKALTGGNVPQFIDLVLNLASTEILQDSLIHSLFKKGQNIVFYGDDTWLKLFPNFFYRYEGTSSFFVRDFKEVDDNVTRNVNVELEKQDWDMMILHYLGLDHIGHVYGPFSSHIPVKLKEMDNIIHNIYSKMAERNEKFLLIVTGDHGMRDSGGHGGSSYFETHVPLLAIGLQCINGTLFQIDVPTNLAVLLGLNIPSTCIGQIRPNLFPISLEKHLFAERYNSILLLKKASLCEDYFLTATKYHEMYIKNLNETYALKAIDLYKNCSKTISENLVRSSVKQNFSSLIISILIMFNCLAILIKNSIAQVPNTGLFGVVEFGSYSVIICIQFILPLRVPSFFVITVLAVFLISNLVPFVKFMQICQNCDVIKFLILISTIHPLTFLSSSFVEEEHEFWYFLINVLFLYLVLHEIKHFRHVLVLLGLLGTFRFLRTINSTGDKWASYPDFSDWLLKSHNYYYYQLFFVFGLLTVFVICVLLNKYKYKTSILHFIILLCIFSLKTLDYGSTLLGKLIWFLILCLTICSSASPKIVSWILISTLLLKPYNTLFISYCTLASMFISKIYQSTTIITFCCFWLGNTLYFAQGHSNSLASVDVSVGYIGLNEYQPFLVILQVLCHTYSLPILCHFSIFYTKNIDSDKVWTILFCNRLYITSVTCIITVIFRHHLFVWSVFAPKLFIESVHLMSLFIEISIYFCFKNVVTFLSYLNNSLINFT